MGLASLTLPDPGKVIGIDASTNSIAYAIFDKGKPERCGEITLNGATVEERIGDAGAKIDALVSSGIMDGDYIAIESAVFVNNRQVVIKLAYVFGAIMGGLVRDGRKIVRVPPIEWQTGIGNPNLTKDERAQLKADNPGKSATWLKAAGREKRKQRTMTIARQYFDIPSNSDNISDAVGIALYASTNLVKQ